MTECSWPIEVDVCCNGAGVDIDTPEGAAILESVTQQVSAMMTRWSGGAFGGCKTIRPLDPCGECREGCCSSGDCIRLHTASTVLEVRVRGEVVPKEDWHYDETLGTLCAVPPLRWPTRDPRHQQVGELEVDVLTGAEPDSWAIAVASELACELLLSCGGQKCRLPQNATTVSSQGVTITMKQDELLYAIPSVISWVHSVNPSRATRPAQVFSPDLRSAMRSAPRAPWSR